jgi:UDP-N-acetylmuramate--alanine ligase
MFEDFSRVLAKVDILLLMDIYPAGELEIQKITSEALASRILKQQSNITTLISSAEAAERELLSLDLENSILVVQGAGDIGILSDTLINKYG